MQIVLPVTKLVIKHLVTIYKEVPVFLKNNLVIMRFLYHWRNPFQFSNKKVNTS